MAKRPELLITTGELAGKRYSVPDDGLRLGRSSSNDVHIPDEELSRNHCLFEIVDGDSIRLTDLASANGTFLNGSQLGGDPAILKVGDAIEVGKTKISVVGDEPVAGAVDLGLGKPKDAEAAAAHKRRSRAANLLWIATIVIVVAVIGVFLFVPVPETESSPAEISEEKPVLQEAYYEKVEADSDGIFRYEMTLSKDGTLSVSVDDVPKEDRHLTKSEPLDAKALAELNDILALDAVRELDREYVGAEPDPPALKSWTLRMVYSTRSRSVRVVNTQEPAAFKSIREKLEAFSKNQLGIWAIQYSRDRLIALAEESLRVGQSKWEDRDVQHGNLFAAVSAYKESIFYLETVNPKPECASVAQKGLEEAQAELDRRYADQRFLADRAINLSQWETARRELMVLLEMISDRNDDRNREASAKLVDVEKRMKGGM